MIDEISTCHPSTDAGPNHLSSDQLTPGCLLYRGDEILPSYMGIVISHEIRITMNQPGFHGMSLVGFVAVAHLGCPSVISGL